MIFSKGVFKKDILHSLGKYWPFLEAQPRRNVFTQENTFCRLLGTQTLKNLTESSLGDSGGESPVPQVLIMNVCGDYMVEKEASVLV